MQYTKSKEIEDVCPTALIQSKFTTKTRDSDFQKLLDYNIIELDVRECVYATRKGVVISGWSRVLSCRKQGKKVPVLYYENELLTDDQEEFLVISHNIKRNLTQSEQVQMRKVLRKNYGISQGGRTDLNPAGQEFRALTKQICSSTYAAKQDYIDKHALAAYNGNAEKVSHLWEKLDTGKVKLNNVFNDIKAKIGKKLNDAVLPDDIDLVTETITLINKDSKLLTRSDTGKVNLIICSPAYACGMYDYDNGNDEFGQELDISSYLNNARDFFTVCYSILEDDGSLFVVISDCVRNGEYKIVPEQFLFMMLTIGWKINDKLIWNKISTQSTSKLNRTVCGHEYLYHFVKSDNFYYNQNWANELPDIQIKTIDDSLTEIPLRSLADKVKNSIITTEKSSTRAIKKMCEDKGFHCGHSATFRIEIPLFAILAASRPLDRVMDIFSGTGVTGAASFQTSRYYTGVEINNSFIEVSKVRLEGFINNPDDFKIFLRAIKNNIVDVTYFASPNMDSEAA